MNKTEKDKAKHWTAFAARLAKFGLGAVLMNGLTITGREKELERLNKFLIKEMPEIADDKKAVAWMKKHKKERDKAKPQWSYGATNFRKDC